MCPNWDCLPQGVLHLISEALNDDPEGLASMRQSCKAWCEGVSYGRISLYPKGFAGEEFIKAFGRPANLDFSKRSFSHVMHTDDLKMIVSDRIVRGIESCVLSGMRKIETLACLTGAGPSLLKLTIDGGSVTDSMLSELIPYLSCLHSLNLEFCTYIRGDFLMDLTHVSNTLNELRIGRCGISLHLNTEWAQAIGSLKQLRELDIKGNNVVDETMKELSKLPNLYHLDIGYSPELSSDGLYFLSKGESARRLRVLKFGLISDFTPEIWKIIPKFPALEALEIAFCHCQGSRTLPDGMAASLWHLPALRKISLVGSDYDWSTIKLLDATCGESLEYLNISYGANHIPLTAGPSSKWSCAAFSEDDVLYFPRLKSLKALASGIPLRFLNKILDGARNLEELDISKCSFKPRSLARRQLLFKAMMSRAAMTAEMCGSEIDVMSSDKKDKDTFAQVLGNLVNLRVFHAWQTDLEDSHCAYLHRLPNLKDINLSSNANISDTSFLELNSLSVGALEKLSLQHTSISDETLTYLSKWAKLKELTVGGHLCRITPNGILQFTKYSSRTLRVLVVEDCTDMSDEGFKLIPQKFPNLTSISLKGCTALSSTGLQNLKKLTKLEKLDLSCIPRGVDDALIQVILQSLPNLSEFMLRGATEMSPRSLNCILESRMLSLVDITSCTGLGRDDNELFSKIPTDSPVKIKLPQGQVWNMDTP
eukprot:jgi/Picsp_1/5347/NSC_02708-R1_partner of paired